ncbi:hypothetical protein GKODMF_14280 [Candidatus Electrothrix gigas]
MIGRNRQVELISQATDNVQIGHSWFDHQDVGPFIHVQGGLPHGLTAVSRVHLVTASIPELRRTVCRIPERTVKGRGIFHRIGHNGHVMKIIFIQGTADLAHSSVHHIRRRNHICARLGMGQGSPGQQFQGGVVIHVITVQAAAMAVVCVLTQADIRDHRQIRGRVLQFLNRLLNNTVLSMSAGPHSVFFFWQTEENDGTYPNL